MPHRVVVILRDHVIDFAKVPGYYSPILEVTIFGKIIRIKTAWSFDDFPHFPLLSLNRLF
jgi:hypothetical protein